MKVLVEVMQSARTCLLRWDGTVRSQDPDKIPPKTGQSYDAQDHQPKDQGYVKFLGLEICEESLLARIDRVRARLGYVTGVAIANVRLGRVWSRQILRGRRLAGVRRRCLDCDLIFGVAHGV